MTADRLEALRVSAIAEGLPAISIIALDNTLRLAIAEVRRHENGGAQVIPIDKKRPGQIASGPSA